MWIFCRYGFFSIAVSDDPDYVMVRARKLDHLLALQKRFLVDAAGEIRTWKNRDYKYRIIIPKASWVVIAAELANEQTWSNFKNETARFKGSGDYEYLEALHDVWEDMYKIQQ